MGEYQAKVRLMYQASELVSSFVARQVMLHAFKVDVSRVGLDEMREYPELVPACGRYHILRRSDRQAGLPFTS